MTTQTSDGFLDMFQGGRTGTGHTGNRHVIDKPGAAVEYGRQASVICGRGGQADKVQACGLCRIAQLAVMFRRHVDHDQPIDTGFLGIGDEAWNTVVVNRVEVTHQHQRGVVVLGTELANHLQSFRQVLFGAQRADVSQLDRRAISHRVGKRHTEFDHVRPCRWQAFEDRQGGVVVRVASGNKGHQRRAILLFEFIETGLQAAHQCFSCLDCSMWNITVCMSLSPRPDRLTTIR